MNKQELYLKIYSVLKLSNSKLDLIYYVVLICFRTRGVRGLFKAFKSSVRCRFRNQLTILAPYI